MKDSLKSILVLAVYMAVIAHNNGKCDITSGNLLDMMELQSEMIEIGLEIELEEYESSMY